MFKEKCISFTRSIHCRISQQLCRPVCNWYETSMDTWFSCPYVALVDMKSACWGRPKLTACNGSDFWSRSSVASTIEFVTLYFFSFTPQTLLYSLLRSLWFQPVARVTSLPPLHCAASASFKSCAWCAWTAGEEPGSCWDLWFMHIARWDWITCFCAYELYFVWYRYLNRRSVQLCFCTSQVRRWCL